MFDVLKNVDVEILANGVMDVLGKVGFLCESETILKAYEKGGAKVDYEKQVAKFPRKMIEEFVEEIRKEDKTGWCDQLGKEDKSVIYSGFHPYSAISEFKAPPESYMFHNLSPFFYDDDKKEKRIGNHQDFATLIKLGDTLHPDQGMGHALILSDCPSKLEPLEAAYTLLEYSHNPRGVYVQDVAQIEYLQEIEAIAGITDPYWHWMANICCNSPLKLDKVVCERLVYMVETGVYPLKLAAMPVSGINIPMTTTGTIVMISAEFIAVWMAARLLQGKKIPLTGMPILGTMDVKTAEISFTALDAALKRLAICDFVKKWTGVRLSPGPGEWSPSKEPGLACTLEKAYFAMTAAAFTGHHTDVGVGHIDAGAAISCVQLLLDYDFTNSLKQLESPKICKEDICMDSILNVEFGLKSNYMEEDSTLNNLYSASWCPEFFSRTGYDKQKNDEAIAKANQKVKQLISEYKKPEGMDDKLTKVRKVIDRAKRNLI
jgi:trimethylamine:corrinoid methyltransferase-like protein